VDLDVGFRPAEERVHVHEHDLRHEQPEVPGELTGDQLRDERPGALAGAAVLHHVQAVVVRLHEAGQGAALAQLRDVAGGGDRPHVGECTDRDIVADATTGPRGRTMDNESRRALQRRNIIDLTTTGRRTGMPRRIEIVYHPIDGRIYISGLPRAQKRAWLANLEANPRFTWHFKGNLGTPVADLEATARVITDPAERRAVCARIIETAWHQQDIDAMTRWSPLIEVTFDEPEDGAAATPRSRDDTP
jgi:deazaflavin-dependent oxidoreductase (nitroreductase family)